MVVEPPGRFPRSLLLDRCGHRCKGPGDARLSRQPQGHSLCAPRTDPINQALALEGAWALNRALRGMVIDPGDVDSRERALYGCYLGAVAFSSAGSGLHHKICRVLGGTFDLPTPRRTPPCCPMCWPTTPPP